MLCCRTILEALILAKNCVMSETVLNNLESQIEALLKTHQQFRAENQLLQQKLVKLTQERAVLLEKNQKAITKIKRMVAQLRNEIL